MNNNQLAKQSNTVMEASRQFGTQNVMQAQEMTRAMAEVQARVVLAKQFPRDIMLVENKIKASCERPSLAQVAEYEYKRGTSKVVGPTIKLLEVIAQCYGNIQSGVDVITRDFENHISHCKAYAWDLENNNYTEIKFDVPHERETKNGNIVLENPRDIYELEANQGSRRKRKCLETVVPRDLIEVARETCNLTLQNGVDIQKAIDQGIQYLRENYKVNLSQIEKYFGIKRQGFNTNQYLALKRIATSLKDGVATVKELFGNDEAEESIVDENPRINDDQVEILCGTIISKGLNVVEYINSKGFTDVKQIKFSDYNEIIKELA